MRIPDAGLAVAIQDGKISPGRGLPASEKAGKPISGKFEFEEGYLNGERVLEHTLDRSVHGGVGIWTKADSVCPFKAFDVVGAKSLILGSRLHQPGVEFLVASVLGGSCSAGRGSPKGYIQKQPIRPSVKR